MCISLYCYCRYEHFDDLVCSLFRNEDYLAPKDEEELEYPDQEDDLQELLFSKCPRCEQVGACGTEGVVIFS